MKTTRHLLALLLLAAPALHAQTATQVWATRYAGIGQDFAMATVVDSAGDAIVTGRSGGATGYDIYTAKYAGTDGHLLWEKRYNNGSDGGNSVAVDGPGNVVVTGYSTDATGANADCYTAKYAGADGQLLWERRYNGTGNGNDYALSVAVDSAGDVAVTGYSTNAAGNVDIYTAKYAAMDGHLLWERGYNGTGNNADAGFSVAMDSAGNVAITGYSIGSGSSYDIYTAKYDSTDGHLLWEQRYNGPGNGADFGHRVAMDSAGHVAVAGYVRNATPNDDYYTAKYDATDGHLLWEQRYNGTGNNADLAYGMAVDSAGDVAVTGRSVGIGAYDIYTAKYAAADGHLLWENRYHATGSVLDGAFSVVVDSAGNVAVGGQIYSNSTDIDYYVAKYAAADGHRLWEARYNGPAYSPDRMDAFVPYTGKLALTADGGVIVTGASLDPYQNTYDYATVRFSPPTPFAVWKFQRLGYQYWSNGSDTDSDGLRLIFEYATGADPLAPSALPTLSMIAGTSALSFSRNTEAIDVTLTVQGSDDLSAWTNLARSTGGAAMVALVAGVTVTESGAGALRTVEVRDLFLTTDPAHPRRFLRLHAAP